MEAKKTSQSEKKKADDFTTDDFTDVFLEELEYIRNYRNAAKGSERKIKDEIKRIKSCREDQKSNQQPPECEKNGDKYRYGYYSVLPSAKAGLVGVALSGGGIRSATFNLGLLQAINQAEMLDKVDYLSTVSGGGYIGTCMTTLMNSPTDKIGLKQDNFPLGRSKIEGSDEPTLEKEPVRRLRYFSNYLTAEDSFLVKYLRPAMVFVKGVFLNLLLIVPYIAIAGLLLALLFNLPVPTIKSDPIFFNFQKFTEALENSNREYNRAMAELRKYAVKRTGNLSFATDQERILYIKGLDGSDKKLNMLQENIKNSKEPMKKHWRSIWILPLVFFGLLIFATFFFRGRLKQSYEERNNFMYACTCLFTIPVALLVLQLYGILIVYWKSWDISLWIMSVALLSFMGPRLLRDGGKNESPGKKGLIKMAIGFGLLLLGPLVILYFIGGIIAWVSCQGNACQIFGMIVGLPILAYINSRFINLNEISLHKYYRDCLSRAYMMQYDKELQNISHKDDLKFSELKPEKSPYFIVNTTLNLKKSKPKNNEPGFFRTGESFIFSKNRCGSVKTGFVSTNEYEKKDQHINIGTAMAISGAAANIGMAQKNIFVLRFLMGLLNVRLGYWAIRPGKPPEGFLSPILKGTPGSFQAFQEWFGFYSLNWRYINLSDGGHFDNIGVYELLRRRCKYIIVGDAEADKDMKFEAISYIIRLARIDFGIEIKIDTSDIKPDPATGFSRAHCAVGRIEYPEGDFGYLLYCKASLTGDEPEHLHEYKVKHPNFPHQTTADQWFDEQQFEAYRELGYHIGKEALNPLEINETSDDTEYDNEEQFNLLKEFWYPHSQTVQEQFTRHTAELNRIVMEIKNDEDLIFMDRQIYPEWESLMRHAKHSPPPPNHLWLPSEEKEIRKGFYLCNLMMQLMENVYTDLNLERDYAHPDNRGWMNLFQHWSYSGMFRVSWTISACTFGARFQKFCKRRFKLDLGSINVEEISIKEPFETILNPYEQNIVKNFYKIKNELQFLNIYSFKLKVRDPVNDKNDKIFHFGFALLDEVMNIRFFRVQDHLQMMGLGRQALKTLVSKFGVKAYYTYNILDFDKIYPNSDAAKLAEQNQKSFEKMASHFGLTKKYNIGEKQEV